MKKVFYGICGLLLILSAAILIADTSLSDLLSVPDYPPVSPSYEPAGMQRPVNGTGRQQQSADNESESLQSQSVPASDNPQTPVSKHPPVDLTKYEGRYAYQSLTGYDALLYTQIAAALDHHEASIPVEISEPKEAMQILSYVLADYPEYFWVEGGGTIITTTRNGKAVSYSLEFIYLMDENQRGEIQTKIDAAAELCLSQIDPGWTEYDKVKAVYDFIITNTEYNIKRSSDQTLYSVMVSGEGVCTGYAKATQYLLSRLGIFCAYITGNIPGRDSHAWNLVKVDGEYYFLDTTWGDPVFDGEPMPEDNISYDYFCITTGDLLKTHQIDSNLPVPECTAVESNYYVRNQLYFDDYSYELILPVVRNAMDTGSKALSFRFSNYPAYKKAMSQLFEENEIFRMIKDGQPTVITNATPTSLTYIPNDDLYIIKIIF